ncbi:unnamed protein product [Mytilus coruscus]|uniref:MAM domain-containing protein n=1 Tax=Mytilus coruscus TaxID=42192 RepID=A0A6J8BHT9_MYTCO|nr:unnamed protein product [Mytilus coruscus]
MKQLWVVVVIWYICVNENYLFTRAEEKFLNLTTGGKGIITCEDNLVIRIEKENVFTDQSYCSSDEIQCDSSDHDIGSRCNGLQNCTIDFLRNTSCMKEDRYFNLSYLCLAPTNVLCTFEFSFCIWKNKDNDMSWKRHSPSSRSRDTQHLPQADQTTGSGDGYYLYLTKSSSAALFRSGNIPFKFNGDKCLELWFNLGANSTFLINKRNSSGKISRLWETKNHDVKTWHQAYIPLGQGLQFEIVIEGRTGNHNDSYIAIDDTDIQEWPCINNHPSSQPVKCNFEGGFCDLKVIPNSAHTWKLNTKEGDWIKRPSFDHTKKVDGNYTYTESLTHQITPRRHILIRFDNKTGVSHERCLSLWYYKYNADNRSTGHLNIYAMINETENILYSTSDTSKHVWHRLQVTVYNADQIILEHNFTNKSYGGLALDDIYVSPIKCSDEDSSFHECVDKHADFHITCPTSDIWNKTTAFNPNISIACQTITANISTKLHKQFRQCNDTGMCIFSPADLFGDHKCSSLAKRLNLTYSCIDTTIFTTMNSRTISTSSQTKGIQDGLPSSSPSSTSVKGKHRVIFLTQSYKEMGSISSEVSLYLVI